MDHFRARHSFSFKLAPRVPFDDRMLVCMLKQTQFHLDWPHGCCLMIDGVFASWCRYLFGTLVSAIRCDQISWRLWQPSWAQWCVLYDEFEKPITSRQYAGYRRSYAEGVGTSATPRYPVNIGHHQGVWSSASRGTQPPVAPTIGWGIQSMPP